MTTAIDVARGGAEATVEVEYYAPEVVQGFIEDSTFCVGYFGPFGCGKTSAGVIKAWRYGQARPGARIAVIRDTWPNLRDTTMKTLFEWFPETSGVYRRTEKTFLLWTAGAAPIEIVFRAMEDKDDVKNVLSLDLAAAWIDEPQGGLSLRTSGSLVAEPGVDHDLFLAILGRVGRQRGYEGRVWLTGNPPAPSHWIASEFRYSPGRSHRDPPTNDRKDFRLYLGDREANRANLPPDYYERLEELYGVGTPMARRFLNGEWVEFGTEQPFHGEWITYYGEGHEIPAPPLDRLVVHAGFDPAISERETAAKSALVVAGQCRGGLHRGMVFVLESQAGHWTPREQAMRLVDAVVKWQIGQVIIEDVAYQRSLVDVVEMVSRDRNVHVPIELVKPDGDKLRRANAWSGLVEEGRVVFGLTHGELIQAMLAVPMDRTKWDLVDAAGMCVRSFPRMRREQSPISQMSEDWQKLARSYAVRSRGPMPDSDLSPGIRGHRLGGGDVGLRLKGPKGDPRIRAVGYAIRPTRMGKKGVLV